MTIGGRGLKKKLIKPINDNDDGTVLYHLKVKELFDVLYCTHTAVGNDGWDRMLLKLKQKYCKITLESIKVFLKFWTNFQKNNLIQKNSLISKAIVHTSFNPRSQIYLIDMQSQNRNDF